MRFATLDRDFWQLRSGEICHRENPATFWIPPIEERLNLKRGHAAKLIFDIETKDESGNALLSGERMWVIVAERIGEAYTGILDCKPASIMADDTAYLQFGAEIPFAAEHVIDIAQPEAIYIEWQLSQAPERSWPRDDC